ncbi:MAG TPA: plastocyanin/azurin family copper-binding protein [Actinomycetota bacterium]|nr:plastocyanin/azurin family copper-binding protein [Actinomycetota bacterium]
MKRVTPFTLVVALALLGACSDDSVPDATTVEMVDGQRFAPAELRVAAGTTVTFVNESAEAHTVTAYEDALPEDAEYFASGAFGTEEQARDALADGLVGQESGYEVTFAAPGTYEYFCIPHEQQGMKGTIVVEE